MRIFVSNCGGVIGPSLISWLLANSDAVIVGTDMSHERIEHLLGVDRFNYYVVSAQPDTHLTQQLIEDSDVIVDLRAIEGPVDSSLGPDEIAEEIRVRNAFVSACASAHVRLVHVSSSDVYGEAVPATRSPNGHVNPGTPDRAIDEQTPVISSSDRSPLELDRAHQQMTQQLIQAYGESGDFDYTIVRVFGALGDHLNVLPRRADTPPLEELCDELARGEGGVIAIREDHLQEQTFIYIADIEDCLGRIVMDMTGQSSQEIFNIGNPANRASPADLARMALARYEEAFWDRRHPLPRFSQDYLNLSAPPQTSSTPSVEKALRLLEWEPQWPLDHAIDDGLAHLFARNVTGPA